MLICDRVHIRNEANHKTSAACSLGVRALQHSKQRTKKNGVRKRKKEKSQVCSHLFGRNKFEPIYISCAIVIYGLHENSSNRKTVYFQHTIDWCVPVRVFTTSSTVEFQFSHFVVFIRIIFINF